MTPQNQLLARKITGVAIEGMVEMMLFVSDNLLSGHTWSAVTSLGPIFTVISFSRVAGIFLGRFFARTGDYKILSNGERFSTD